MKTKEERADNYVQMQYIDYGDFNYRVEEQIREGFLNGFDSGQPEWISVDKQLPDNDRTVLVWINDTENPQWSGYKLGSYLNEKWYCKGGRESHEIVTDWSEIPAKKK